VFNVLPGFGHTVGEALAMHMDVDCITFTGSTKIGKHLVQCSGKSNLKRAFMECGGKSPNIVLADAPDLDAAASAVGAIFYNQGSVHRRLPPAGAKQHQAPVHGAAAGPCPRMDLGQPARPTTRIGAMVDHIQMEQVLNYIAIGQQEGAKLLLGGKRTQPESGGFYIEPTIFDEVTPRCASSARRSSAPCWR
jgi:acyl-CoA reductase-like NAD-dependent aldehyde dehydrogenase